MRQAKIRAHVTPLVALDRIAVRNGERFVFRRTTWAWQPGQQWAILGPNGSGKSVLARALAGQAPVAFGEISFHLTVPTGSAGRPGSDSPEDMVALLSPESQRALTAEESSFHQSRWHSGIAEGRRTVAQFLSQESVERINPFEIAARHGPSRDFRRRSQRFVASLDLTHLLRRKLIHLSSGEQRKVLLVHALLRAPRLLILDDPFGGLDLASRARLKMIVDRLMRAGLPVLVATSRPDEIPRHATHVLLVDRERVVAQGPKAALLRHPLARRLAVASRRQVSNFLRSPRPSHPPLRPTSANLVELHRVTIDVGRKRILEDVSWSVREGEHWALLGPNGAGKTTLLALLQGDHPQVHAADIHLFGRRPDATDTLWHARQRIGWMSPELLLHYPAQWPCLEVVCSGFFNSVGLYRQCSARQRAAARRWLGRLGLAQAAHRAFGDLSLGDQRLVLLARAAVKRPRLLILDEPCQGLDAAHRKTVLDAVDQAVATTGASLVFTTHHPRELPHCITHRLRLRAGRITVRAQHPPSA